MGTSDGTGRVFAVIDVGSNSVRLLVARALSESAFEVVDEERFDARLGEGLTTDLSEAAMERGLRGMRLVTQVAASHAPDVTVAVGTEALRKAQNRDEFVRRVVRQTGLDLRILSAREEAEASFLGTINATTLQSGLIVDIGGGSLEFIRFAGRAITGAQSAPLGALYAVDRYLHSDPPTGKEVRALQRAVRTSFDFGKPEAILIGVGGAVRNLARITRGRREYPIRRLHGLSITRAEMKSIAEDLVAVPAAQRKRIPGVSSARADSLHAAVIALDETMACVGASAMLISGQGLREGLVWQQLRPADPVLADVRTASVTGLARANGIDERAAQPVAEIALQLFDVTRPAHGLGDQERDLLRIAALLAGIGMHVDYYNRDRHAEYLIHSGDLSGFTHREIVMLAGIVRSAQAGAPDLSPYRTIATASDRRNAGVLAALLGAAEAVRRRPRSPVSGLRTSLEAGMLRIDLESSEVVDTEVISLERQARRLGTALRLRVEVSARCAPEAAQHAILEQAVED